MAVRLSVFKVGFIGVLIFGVLLKILIIQDLGFRALYSLRISRWGLQEHPNLRKPQLSRAIRLAHYVVTVWLWPARPGCQIHG